MWCIEVCKTEREREAIFIGEEKARDLPFFWWEFVNYSKSIVNLLYDLVKQSNQLELLCFVKIVLYIPSSFLFVFILQLAWNVQLYTYSTQLSNLGFNFQIVLVNL